VLNLSIFLQKVDKRRICGVILALLLVFGAFSSSSAEVLETGVPVVYMTADISSEGLMAVYQALGREAAGGNVAIKISTGENGSNYLRVELIGDFVQAINGTIVECNTAYGGNRANTARHYQLAEDHGYTSIAKVDIMDEDGSMTLPVVGGTVLTENYVGAHLQNYDFLVVLSHFKGHAMGGFGGGNGFSGSGFSDRGNDLNAEVQITFDGAVHGCEKTITIQNPNQPGSRPQTLQVKIPAGIETGKSIRLAGKGMPGTGGGAAGDLLLKITVGEKPGWTRKGMDVYTDVEVPFTTAVFGGETLVHTLYGDVVCKIKAGTHSGTKIRLRGKGIVSLKDPSTHGDQYAVVRIQVPDNLSPEAKQKLKEFEEICRRDGRFHAA